MKQIKLLVLPRDPNPFQELLYAPMRARGVRVAYLADYPGRIWHIRLLIAPIELIVRRALGWRVLHLHWVYWFALPGTRSSRRVRAINQSYFSAFLWLVRALGMRIVWTAHNVLPHEPIFRDDVAARRKLVAAADAVFVHQQATADQLVALGMRPKALAEVPLGPFSLSKAMDGRTRRSSDSGVMRVLYFGQVREYKGVEDLVAAASSLPRDARILVRVVGACHDPLLRRRILEARRRFTLA